jgi:8-oxo-dGTP diphosphatase
MQAKLLAGTAKNPKRRRAGAAIQDDRTMRNHGQKILHGPCGGFVCGPFGKGHALFLMSSALPYKISVLVFIENAAHEQLLLLRAKEPNLGLWSPIGGKLEMTTGESPFECAVRETAEETGFKIAPADLHLFAMIAEKAYQGSTHWLMFLFRCKAPITDLPTDISEGKFAFFSRDQIKTLAIPETDKIALWPIFDQYHDGFVALKADCRCTPIQITVEQITGLTGRAY